VLDSAYNLIFGCRHRHTTFPLTPAKKSPSEPSETYVVCLDCGKQFIYDWENMRLDKPADISASRAEQHPEAEKIPFKTKSNLRYVALASALPLAWVIRNAIKSRKKSKAAESSSHENAESDRNDDKKTPGTT
jgi:hypothetical protein